MFHIHPRQNGFDLSITGHFLEVHVSEDDETCLYCHCDVTRGQGVKVLFKGIQQVIRILFLCLCDREIVIHWISLNAQPVQYGPNLYTIGAFFILALKEKFYYTFKGFELFIEVVLVPVKFWWGKWSDCALGASVLPIVSVINKKRQLNAVRKSWFTTRVN